MIQSKPPFPGDEILSIGARTRRMVWLACALRGPWDLSWCGEHGTVVGVGVAAFDDLASLHSPPVRLALLGAHRSTDS